MSQPDTPIIVTVLRHGLVEGRAQVFRGADDVALSREGWQQMRQSLAHVTTEPFDHIASSPLRRCHEFAAYYAWQQQLTAQVLVDFRELNFGAWEGLSPEEAAEQFPEDYSAFRRSFGDHAPTHGESLADLCQRVHHAWQHWMQHAPGQNRLLVTHAGVMRALLMVLFQFTPSQAFQFALPEAATLRISHLPGHAPYLLSLN